MDDIIQGILVCVLFGSAITFTVIVAGIDIGMYDDKSDKECDNILISAGIALILMIGSGIGLYFLV